MVGTNDRYPSPTSPQSDPVARLAERVRELERRVGELAGARPLQHTAMTGGQLKVVDPVTGDAVATGIVREDEDGSKYGLQLISGGVVFEVNGLDGFRQPAFQLVPIPQKALGVGPYVVTTSGTFEACYRAFCTVTHRAIEANCVVVTDASTVGEVRLRHQGTGATTAAITCVAGGQTDIEFRWRHDQPIGTGPHRFELQARRVSGAGNVNVFWPESMAMISPTFATENGLV